MKAKKVLALILSGVLCISVLSGCTEDDKNVSNSPSPSVSNPASPSASPSAVTTPDYMNATGYPITKEPVTIKALGQKDPGGTEWGDLRLFQEMEKITNIKFDFELVETTNFSEKKNLALATGQYPDVIIRNHSQIMDEELYGPQGTFIDLAPLIDQYSPNLKALMEKEPQVKPSITSLDGSIYGLPYFCRTATRNPHTCYMNGIWLDNLGISEPKTTDEFYEMLKAFKEKDANKDGDPNNEIPWSASRVNSPADPFLMSAFTGSVANSTRKYFDVMEGKVVYAPVLDGFKEYLEYCNKLYKEDLMDPETFTQTSQQWQAKAKSGNVGVFNVSPTIMDPNSTDRYITLEPLTSSTNSLKVVPDDDLVYTTAAVITDKCMYPEALIRYFDIWFADEEHAVEGICGTTLFVGYEGEHWKYTDDTKKKYEMILPIKNIIDLNKEITVTEYLPGYLDFTASPTGSKFMEMKVSETWAKQYPYVREAFPANIRYTSEETEKLSVAENDLFTYTVQMETKFVTGEESLENYDKFVEELDKIGLSDIIKIKQNAYDRWMAASK
jgi:putative aldouronate transport system substrate-binding protein